MGEIHVQFESLQTGEQGIRQNYAALTATLEQLNSELRPMLESWSGSAQEAYVACKHQWDEGAQALSQVLNTIGQAVGQAHTNYVGAERAAQSNWA